MTKLTEQEQAVSLYEALSVNNIPTKIHYKPRAVGNAGRYTTFVKDIIKALHANGFEIVKKEVTDDK